MAGLTVQAVAISLYGVERDVSVFYVLAVLVGAAYGGVMPFQAALVRE